MIISVTVIGLSSYLTFAPEGSLSPWFTPAKKILSAIGYRWMKPFWTAFVAVHSLEGLYTYALCKKHTDFVVGVNLLLFP
jgi:hypothetical protein